MVLSYSTCHRGSGKWEECKFLLLFCSINSQPSFLKRSWLVRGREKKYLELLSAASRSIWRDNLLYTVLEGQEMGEEGPFSWMDGL